MDAGSGMDGGANGGRVWERCGLGEAVIAVWVGKDVRFGRYVLSLILVDIRVRKCKSI